MGNWAEEVCAPVEAHNRNVVLGNTWGYLAPQKNTTYRGKLLVSCSVYRSGTQEIIDMEWENLEDSPWLYDSVNDWLWGLRDKMERGSIYRIEATFRNYRFWGKPIKIASL